MLVTRLCSLVVLSCMATPLLAGINDPQTAERPAETPAPPPDPLQSLKDEITRLTTERDRVTADLTLEQAKLDKELSESKNNTLRLQAQLAEIKAKQDLADYQKKITEDKTLASLRSHLDRAMLENSIAKAETDTESMEIRRVETALRKDTTRLAAQMELEQKEAEARTYAQSDPIYLDDPLQDRRLVLSDRRIGLNGLITMTTADQVTDRINYFNNRDSKMPIFIVIDDSPGGSVMAGYKILKAMQGSEAPVYVVVKSFAASMAACITTLAKKSYAYPNAVIMHHQIAAFSGGNLTQQQEWVREMEEWWRRLAGPVADKMGITREDFIKRMYARTSTGDWSEFADEAQKLKWVDNIVDEIEETGTIRHPDAQIMAANSPGIRMPLTSGPVDSSVKEMVDEKGRPFMTLPRLNPMDCYWLYNPDGYYRLP